MRVIDNLPVNDTEASIRDGEFLYRINDTEASIRDDEFLYRINDTEASIRDGEQSLSDDDFVSNTA